MAKIVLLDAAKPFYKANLHCHSTKSDGKMSVEEIKALYKKNGYAIVAFTDHEHLIDNSHLNDEEFLTITSCELGIKEYERLSTLVKQDMKVCHLNLYAKDPKNVDTPCYNSVYDHYRHPWLDGQIVHSCGEYQREYSARGICEMIRIANEKGFLVCYNHPKWSLENATDYLGYRDLWGVELYNTSCVNTGLFEYNSHVYDDFLRDGQRIACVAGDDNHTQASTCGGFTMINADSLSYDAVITAMEQHRLYASTGPLIHELYVEGKTAYLTYSAGVMATMSTRGRRAQLVRADATQEAQTVCFTIQPDDGYVRFDVVDEHGNRANTCAYFVEDLLVT